MSGYNMECFVKDFARRTRVNRGIVSGANGEHYEVTQLINSLLGLVIIPHEAFFDRIANQKTGAAKTCPDEIKAVDAIVKECIEAGKYYSTYKSNTAFDFIKHIRNSVAHGGNEGLMFFPITEGGDNRLESVLFYDHNVLDNGEKQEFCCELSISRLERFVKRTEALYVKIEEKYGRDNYWERVESCRELFNERKCSYRPFEELIIHG